MSAGDDSLHAWSLSTAAIGLAMLAVWLLAPGHIAPAWLAAAHGAWAALGFGYLFLRIRGHQRWADRVTASRVVLCVLLFAAFALDPRPAWWKLGMALLVLVLDGVDGTLARRHGPTRAGAVFDMESDSFFVITLCGICHLWLGLGAWVLVLAALRPAYVLAWAVLQVFRPLRSPNRKGSLRARLGYLFMIIALLGDLASFVPASVKTAVTATAVALLSVSFLIDAVASLRPG